jgi:hypothetical protein
MINKASADPREPHWLLLPGCSRDAVMALTQPKLTAEERERLANDLLEADSYERLSAWAKELFDRAHERHVWHLGFAPAGERLHGGACEQSCKTLADVRATLAECQGARGMRVDGAGRRTHEVRVDWEKTVLDADVLCPDCGSLTHHHGVFPDLLLQCSICGGWYSADAGLYLGDEVRVIVRGYRLRKHARIAWMLEEAIRDREAEPGNEDYRDELRERSATEFADEGQLCAHLLTKRSCHICGLEEQMRRARGRRAPRVRASLRDLSHPSRVP